MQFLTPLFWIGSLALAVPVLIHLVRRERSRTLQFSSLRFLRPLTRKSFKYLQLRNPLLLLLRLLFLLILVAAFSRPYLPGATTPLVDPPAARATVILLDNSFSMSLAGRLESARRKAAEFIGSLGSQDEVALVTFAETPEVLSGLTRDRSILSSLLDRVQQSSRTTDFIPALRAADKMLADRSGAKRTILLISDLQKIGFRQEEPFRLSPSVTLQVSPVVEIESGLAAVTDMRLEVGTETNRRTARLSARLLQLTPGGGQVTSSLLLNGKPYGEKRLTWGSDNVIAAEFEDIAWPEGSVRGEVRTQAAGYASSFYFVSEGRARDEVLLIEGPRAGRSGRRPSYYLSRALSSQQAESFVVRTATLPEAASLPLGEFRTLFLIGVDAVSGDLARRLRSAVQEGTGLVIALGPGSSIQAFNGSFAQLAPAIVESAVTREREPVGVMGNIRYRHPVFKVFSETRTGNFLASRFHGYHAVQPREGAQVLARFDDGNPVLVEQGIDRGRVLLVTTSLDNSWNDLPLNPVFLPFVHQLVSYAGAIDAPRSWFWVGESLDMSEEAGPTLQGGARVPHTYAGIPGSKQPEVPVRDPLFTFEQKGIYSFRSNDRLTYRAVNVRPAEWNLATLDGEAFAAALTAPAASADSAGEETGGTPRPGGERDLGPLLLGMGLLLLIGEVVVANRAARQVL